MSTEKERDIPSAPELKAPKTTEPKQAVPQLIHSVPSARLIRADTDATVPSEPSTVTRPVEDHAWTEQDEAGKHYDPGRGDYVDHLNDTTPKPEPVAPKKPKRRKGWGWLVFILLLAIGGAGAYVLLGPREASAPESTTTSTPQTTPKQTEEKKVETKQYDSTNFALGVTYPKDWLVKDTDTLFSLTSPETTFETYKGEKVKAYIRLTVQPKQTSLPDFADGPATAVMESSKLTYKQPSEVQQAQTYITFAGYATGVGGLDAVYVTGNNGYQIRQEIPEAGIVRADPLITVKFLTCTSQECTGTVEPLSVKNSQWVKTSTGETVTDIIESFVFN